MLIWKKLSDTCKNKIAIVLQNVFLNKYLVAQRTHATCYIFKLKHVGLENHLDFYCVIHLFVINLLCNFLDINVMVSRNLQPILWI